MKGGNRLPAAGAAFLVLLLSAASSRGDEIKQAIERGVAYLKTAQRGSGSWENPTIGATALAGLTLLECDEPADSDAVQRAAAAVRFDVPTLTHTYSLALSIMFLDRLGDSADVPLIESMAVRLLAGQVSSGGWHYDCPRISDAEARRLKANLEQPRRLVASRDLPPPEKRKRRETSDLTAEIQSQVAGIRNQRILPGGPTDNSNTQFAILALWIARRHGIPVDQALARVERRFRVSQNEDGGWGYRPQEGSTRTMVCAGLLGLAMAYGLANEAVLRSRESLEDKKGRPGKPVRSPGRDANVQAGLEYLGGCIPSPLKRTGGSKLSSFRPTDYYFLWSLERVGVAYGLKTICRKDWYAWGSQNAVATQRDNGSWENKYGPTPDTCFALLFLRRSNLAGDLSTALHGQVKDPLERRLQASGVSGQALAKDSEPANPAPAKSPRHPEPDVTPVEKPVPAPTIHDPRPAPAPDDSDEREATRLKELLVNATEVERDGLLERFKQARGSAYTAALAQAIPQLHGGTKTKAREALAGRLSRMTARTLEDKLQDDDAEIRRGAAVACILKEDKSLIPSLIPLLEDAEKSVMLAAHLALKELSGQDFGPAASATKAERADATSKWKSWWQKQNGK
jgi:hypothetical protein